MASDSPLSDGDFDEDIKTTEKKQRKPCAQPRKLTRWDLDKDQLVLLCLDNVCIKLGIALPWDAVAKLVEPDGTLSGEAIKQHLGKVYKARVAFGLPVPEKADKPRRKAGKAADGDASTPAKRGRVKKEVAGDADEEDNDTPVKGANLLYAPAVEKLKTPKKAKNIGVGRGNGRKKAPVLDEAETLSTPCKSTGKRGRTTKPVKKEAVDESDYETPSKKLRQTSAVNYAAQMDPDSDEDVLDARQAGDEEDVDEEPLESQNAMMKHGSNSMQESNAYNFPQSQFGLPHPGLTNPFDSTHTYGGNTSGYVTPRGDFADASFGDTPKFGPFNQIMGAGNLNYGQGPAYGFSGYKGVGSMPTNSNPYMSNTYGQGISGFHPELSAQLQDQLERVRGHYSLPTVPEEDNDDTVEVEHKPKPKPKTPRKKATPKEKKTPKAWSASKAVGGGGNRGDVQKVETSMQGTGADPFGENEVVGNIPIMNQTGMGYPNNLGYGQNQYGMNSLGLDTQTNFNQASDMSFTASPATLVSPNPLTFNVAGTNHSSATPNMAKWSFDNSQLNQMQSHNNSFVSSGESSVVGSQTMQPVPIMDQSNGGQFEQGTGANFGARGYDMSTYDPLVYQQSFPIDEYANDFIDTNEYMG